MSQIHGSDHLNSSDKRHMKGRFGWVKRLMQGQTRQSNGSLVNHGSYNSHPTNKHAQSKSTDTNPKSKSTANKQRSYSMKSNVSSVESDNISNNTEIRSGSDNSNSDNVSTIPLKSIVSMQSTRAPSILSDSNQDQSSYVASTAETSIAPSVQTTANNLNSIHHNLTNPDRDSESIVTLASSSRRIRRRSIDTNCSTVGIPPASIMERLSIQQTAANSSYAVSVRTSTDRIEPSQSSFNDVATDQNSSINNESPIGV